MSREGPSLSAGPHRAVLLFAQIGIPAAAVRDPRGRTRLTSLLDGISQFDQLNPLNEVVPHLLIFLIHDGS